MAGLFVIRWMRYIPKFKCIQSFLLRLHVSGDKIGVVFRQSNEMGISPLKITDIVGEKKQTKTNKHQFGNFTGYKTIWRH